MNAITAIEIIEGWMCTECGLVTDAPSEEPAYECGACGETFTRENSADGDSHRCPHCNRFAGKLHDNAYRDCDGETEEVQAFECSECAQFHAVDEVPGECMTLHTPIAGS